LLDETFKKANNLFIKVILHSQIRTLYFLALTDYFNQNWIMYKTKELIETLLEKLNFFLIMLWIPPIEFYIYWAAWNYPTFTNVFTNWCINIARLIYEKTLNPKLWTQFLLSRSSFFKCDYVNIYQRMKTCVLCASIVIPLIFAIAHLYLLWW